MGLDVLEVLGETARSLQGTACPPGLAVGQGSDGVGLQTSYLTLDFVQPSEATGRAGPGRARPVFLWIADAPRLCSHDVPFHEAVACSERLFAMPNAAQIPFYDLWCLTDWV